MALVSYSDSEGSDTEEPHKLPQPTTTTSTFQKPTRQSTSSNTAAPRKIHVQLPSLSQGSQADSENTEPPVKRARTAGNCGAFSGFNALLPPPKRTAQKGAGLKPGVSLKTSSVPVFSRKPVEATAEVEDGEFGDGIGDGVNEMEVKKDVEVEPKLVGSSTRFLPLSVMNSRKKKKKVATNLVRKVPGVEESRTEAGDAVPATKILQPASVQEAAPSPPPRKPKKSLFSMHQPDEEQEPGQTNPASNPSAYEPLTTTPQPPHPDQEPSLSYELPTQPLHTQPTLSSTADDLNLTPSQRRQLLGRNSHQQPITLTRFNTSTEYAANEALRQAGEVQEHRAVKTIAPGKHSLQQLVNNARSQREGLEDKWAEGRRERGEGRGRYGWG